MHPHKHPPHCAQFILTDLLVVVASVYICVQLHLASRQEHRHTCRTPFQHFKHCHLPAQFAHSLEMPSVVHQTKDGEKPMISKYRHWFVPARVIMTEPFQQLSGSFNA